MTCGVFPPDPAIPLSFAPDGKAEWGTEAKVLSWDGGLPDKDTGSGVHYLNICRYLGQQMKPNGFNLLPHLADKRAF